MAGRRFGPGKLVKVPNYAGTETVYRDEWTDAVGKRRKRILSGDRRIAERAFAKIIRDRDLEALGMSDEQGQFRTLDDLRERYLADLAVTVTRRQHDRIRVALEKVLDALLAVRVIDLRVEQVLAYRQGRIKAGIAHRTINLEVGALKSMLRWALHAQIISRNPITHVKPLPTGKAYETRPRRALTREEIDRLLEAAQRIDEHLRARYAAEQSSKSRGQYYAARKRRAYRPQLPLWRALLFTGARWGELTAVLWSDVDLDAKTMRLRPATTKNRRGRIIPLVDLVVDDLRPLQGEPDEHVFLSPRGKPVADSYRRVLYRFRELLKEAGIVEVDAAGDGVDIHSLRHSFCSELARAGVPLISAQKLMGHSDPKLTASLYSHMAVEDLRGAVARMASS